MSDLPPVSDEEAEAWGAMAAEYPHLENRLIRLLSDRKRDKARIEMLETIAKSADRMIRKRQARIAELERALEHLERIADEARKAAATWGDFGYGWTGLDDALAALDKEGE